MHRDHRVVAYTPYGREQTVSILAPYMLREHKAGVLDEWMLCMNTDEDQVRDREYAHELAERFDWIKLYERPGPDSPPEWTIPDRWRTGYMKPKQRNTGRFFWYMQDRSTVYLRFDDDVVWVHPNTMRRLVEWKLDRPEALAIFPTIWNNAVASWWLQEIKHPTIPKHPKAGQGAMNPVGWKDPNFAIELHGNLLAKLEAGEEDDLLVPKNYQMPLGLQFSVSCFSIHGKEYADLNGVITFHEEEHWLTKVYCKEMRRPNIIVGDAHVSHFSFHPQRQMLLNNTDYLQRYRALAAAVGREALQ
jgi:hypothetical protein